MKVVTKTVVNETRDKRGGYIGMLLGTLASILLGNMLTGSGFLRTGYGNKENEL